MTGKERRRAVHQLQKGIDRAFAAVSRFDSEELANARLLELTEKIMDLKLELSRRVDMEDRVWDWWKKARRAPLETL